MEYVYLGTYAEVLEGGAPVGPRDVVHLDAEAVRGNQHLIDAGVLQATGAEVEQTMTTATLTEKARELEIEGRSRMSTDELRAAVAEAEEG